MSRNRQSNYCKKTGSLISAVTAGLAGMPSPLMEKYIKRPALLKKLLREALLPKIDVWKTITVGQFKGTNDDMKVWLERKGICFDKYILDSYGFTRYKDYTKIDLVKITAAQIGFDSGKRLPISLFYEAVQDRGLVLCKGEVGPELRDQYRDQPVDETLNIGMWRVRTGIDVGTGYRLQSYNDGTLRLDRRSLRIDTECDEPWMDPDELWVFVKPRK